MGTKYSTNTASGYNATPPVDDGTVSEANKVKWSTIKIKLTDPPKDLADTINSELVTHFNSGPNAYTTSQTLGAANYNSINQVSGAGVVLTLTDAATLAAGWYCDIVNTDATNTVSLARATAADMINETSADVTIQPLSHLRAIVNAAANGFLVTNASRITKAFKTAEDYTHSGTVTMSGKSMWTAEGAAVASAADCNIWTTDGNTVHLTGTTAPSDWGTAPQAGASKWCTNDSALTLTYNATTNVLPGDANIALPANSWFEVYAKSTSTYEVRQILFSDGRSLGLVSGTTIATTSGTSHSISIPPWAKKITLMWNAGSTNGISIPISRIGDSGGAETTGYVSAAHARDGAGSARATATDGFLLNYDSAAANVLYATLVITLVDAATFLWHAHGAYYETATSSGRIGVLSGSKALSAALTTIHLTTQNGTDTTDAGSLNCMWE